MISNAHIGVGIIGREGLHASRVSDYAIAQFSFLRRLLFVHGRECYRRNSFVVIFTFYKNIVLIGPQVAFAYYSYLSAQSIYESTLFEFYNICFTTFVIIWFAIADKEYSLTKLEQDGRYYIQGIEGKCFSVKKFWTWNIYGIIEGVLFLIFFANILKIPIENGQIKELGNIGILLYKLRI